MNRSYHGGHGEHGGNAFSFGEKLIQPDTKLFGSFDEERYQMFSDTNSVSSVFSVVKFYIPEISSRVSCTVRSCS